MSSRRLLLSLTLALALTGCPGQGDVDRTQPGRLAKSVFTGEWYYRFTVTDVPSNSAASFTGEQGEMDRIRWEITETRLHAYRTYVSTPGGDNDFNKGTNNRDAPVASFAVQGHFDVKRSYNAATGEQTNVIIEDSADRPWFDREFMRVDWSRNLVNGSMLPEEAIPETDKVIDPDRAFISEGYIDVSTRAQVSPYFCAAMTSWANCSTVNVKGRSSFLKIDKINQAYLAIADDNTQPYEPLVYRDGLLLKDEQGNVMPAVKVNGAIIRCTPKNLAEAPELVAEDICSPARMEMFAKFGFFRTERDTYDRDLGFTQSGKVELANRWNIWAGKVKDVPYSERRTRKILYYTNTQFPSDLFPQAQEIGRQFNKAFTDTVAALRLNELNGSAGVTSAQVSALSDTLEPIFEVRQNSCNLGALSGAVPGTADWAKAHPHALKQALTRLEKAGVKLSASLEDLSPQNLEVFCTALEDVTRNEANAADRFVWQRLGDLRFSLLNWVDKYQAAGPLGYGPSSPDPLTGELINANANMYGAGVDAYAASAAEIVEVLNGTRKLDGVISGNDLLKEIQANSSRRAFDPSMSQLDELFGQLPSKEELRKMKSAPANFAQSRLELIKGTALEKMAVDSYIAALDPSYKQGQPITQAVIDRVSPASRAVANGHHARERLHQLINPKKGNSCVYMADFADDSIVGWAMEQKAKNATHEQIFAKARADIFLGVALHEVGHTVGLRHNFEGSTDALNYFDEYWKIRKNVPEAKWPENKLGEYGYSSIMDYGGKFNADIHGLGKYDFAAIKFGYGQLVEAFPADLKVAITGDELREASTYTYGFTSLPSLFPGSDMTHNTNRITLPYGKMIDDVRKALLADTQAETREVPYRFCSDEYEGSLNCKVFDEGASQLEVAQNAANQYKNYWYFSAFMRDRLGWSIDSYMGRLTNRYFDKFSTAFQYFYYFGRNRQNTFFGQDLARASMVGLNTLHEVLATPDTGNYCLPTAESGYNVNVYAVLPEAACDATKPAVKLGYFSGAKPYFPGFSDDYYWSINRSGAMYDKIAALQALTDSSARFYRVDDWDNRSFAINFYRMWRPQMLRILGGLLLDDSSGYGGVIKDGQYVPPMSLGGSPELAGLPKVESTTNPTVQFYALLYSMALLNNTLDASPDISSYLKVSLRGASDDLEYVGLPPDRLAEVTDPRTGRTYRTAATDDGLSISYPMIKDLAAFVTGPYATAKARLAGLPANATAADRTSAQNTVANMERFLSSRVELLDDIRTMQAVFAAGQQ
jgi:hypothetical protein